MILQKYLPIQTIHDSKFSWTPKKIIWRLCSKTSYIFSNIFIYCCLISVWALRLWNQILMNLVTKSLLVFQDQSNKWLTTSNLMTVVVKQKKKLCSFHFESNLWKLFSSQISKLVKTVKFIFVSPVGVKLHCNWWQCQHISSNLNYCQFNVIEFGIMRASH